MLDGSVEDAARSLPDVATGAVAFDERNDRVERNLQLAATVIDGRAFLWNGLPIVSALHLARPPGTISSKQKCSAVRDHGALRRVWPNLQRYHKAACC